MATHVTVHVAGPLIDLVQHCARCGVVLSDYRHTRIPKGDPLPKGWPEGANIEIDKTYSGTTDDPPTCRERS